MQEQVNKIDRELGRLIRSLETQEKRLHGLIVDLKASQRQLEVYGQSDPAYLIRRLLATQAVLNRAGMVLSTLTTAENKPAHRKGSGKKPSPAKAAKEEPSPDQPKTTTPRKRKPGVHVIVLNLLRAASQEETLPDTLEEALELSLGNNWRNKTFSWPIDGKLTPVYFGDDLERSGSYLRQILLTAKTTMEEIDPKDLQHQAWLITEGLRQKGISASELLGKWLGS